jgi:uncharacterized protein YdeI (YjbR/CyaY-like superfamily)
LKPRFFATPAAFRAWLERHHADTTELWVGFYKRDSGRPGITWPESVDEALCFGWIDGVRKSLSEESYVIRFTPRRQTSRWSEVNLRRMAALIAEGRVRPAGREAYDRRDEEASRAYSYEQRHTAELPRPFEKRFRAHREAWRWFQEQPPGYRRIAVWYVVSAKREETRERRFGVLLDASARGERIGLLQRPAKTSAQRT